MLRLPYQDVGKVRQALKKTRCLLLCLPTGAGKTVMGILLIQATLEKNSKARCMFIVELDILVKQTSEKFNKEGLEHGIIQGKRREFEKNITIASAQTLFRIGDFNAPDLTIVDEAHHATKENAYYQPVIKIKETGKTVIGLSATPIAKEVLIFDDILVLAKNSDLINLNKERGFGLVPAKIIGFDKEYLKSTQQNSNDELSNVLGSKKIMGNVLRNYEKYALGKKTIAFFPLRKISMEYCKLFNESGYPTIHIDGTTNLKDRKMALDLLGEGKVNVFNVGILHEGFDMPSLEVVMLLTLTKSFRKYIQMGGRTLRSFQGKEYGTIIDFCGNHIAHEESGVIGQDVDWETLFWKSQNRIKLKRDNEFEPIDTDSEGNKGVDDEMELVDPDLLLHEIDTQKYITKLDVQSPAFKQALKKDKPTVLGAIRNKYEHFKKLAEEKGYKHGFAWVRTIQFLGISDYAKEKKTDRYKQVQKLMREIKKGDKV